MPRVGIPWALFGALALVGLVELGVRSVEPRALFPYDYGENEYYADAGHISAYGAAEVSIVGSSRGKEAVVVPQLAGAWGMTVRNYACAGARADETRAVVEFLLRHGTPKLILCEVTPRVFLEADRRWARSAIFWNWADWRSAFAIDPGAATRVLPVMARNSLGEVWCTLRFRQKPVVLVDDVWVAYRARRRHEWTLSFGEFLAGGARPTPLNGQITERMRDVGTQSLVTHPRTEEEVRAYVDRLLLDGKYVMGDVRLEELIRMAEACEGHGVRLVFFEVPVSEILRRHLPEDTYPGFYSRMAEVVRATGASFVPADSLGVEFGDADFAEHSHLNLVGAEKLTAALAHRLRP